MATELYCGYRTAIDYKTAKVHLTKKNRNHSMTQSKDKQGRAI
jgi:hypothetical protein